MQTNQYHMVAARTRTQCVLRKKSRRSTLSLVVLSHERRGRLCRLARHEREILLVLRVGVAVKTDCDIGIEPLLD